MSRSKKFEVVRFFINGKTLNIPEKKRRSIVSLDRTENKNQSEYVTFLSTFQLLHCDIWNGELKTEKKVTLFSGIRATVWGVLHTQQQTNNFISCSSCIHKWNSMYDSEIVERNIVWFKSCIPSDSSWSRNKSGDLIVNCARARAHHRKISLELFPQTWFTAACLL